MSTDYSLFDEAMRDRFVEFVSATGVASEIRQDPMGGFVVALPEDLADAVLERIEAEYATLMNEQMVDAESKEGWVTHRVAGVTVTLADGRPCVVRLSGAIARRLFEHFTPEEVTALVSAIVQSVDNPVDAPLCRKA
ncbi:MAG: hypothetical protein ABI886_06335 [Betaproteobacteria bacterium]